MGKRRPRGRQRSMWVASSDLPSSAGNPFYERLNRVLDEAGFDVFTEEQCAKFYADGVGRPSLAPGRYFRMLLLGYFEGLDSERAIAWRSADSLSLREFLDIALHEASPDHSTVSRTRRRIDLETHEAVFTWVLRRRTDAGLVKGKTIGIDATTLEANAAMRSIVRRDTGEGYEAFLHRLAVASGIATPTRAELARLDRKRPKKGSNDDWTHPQDPDAKITKMKDGRTHLAYKAEHAVDLESGAVVGMTVQDAHAGDTTTMVETLVTAAEQVESGAAGGRWYRRGRRRQGLSQQRNDGRAVRPRASRLRVGAGSRATLLEGQAVGARGCVWQPASNSGCPRETPAATARRTAGTPERPSLRDRGHAPGVSARAYQHPEAPSGASLRLQSGLPHAQGDGRRDAAQPPGPRRRARRGLDRRAERPLAPCSGSQGRHFARVARSGPDSAYDVASSAWPGRSTQRPFRHGLLGQA